MTVKPERFSARYDKYVVTEFRSGCVFKTKKIGEAWFLWGKGPKTNILNEKNEMWCPTMVEMKRTDYQELT